MAFLTRRRVAWLAASLVATLARRKPAQAGQSGETLYPPSDMLPIVPPPAAPTAQFLALDGTPSTLAAFLGRPVVLNFWATWCTPCVAELPELDRLAQAAPGVTVLAVSADRGAAGVVGPFLATHPVTHATILLDPHSEAVHAFGVFGFPTTVLIDATGHVRARLEGPAAWAGAGALVAEMTK